MLSSKADSIDPHSSQDGIRKGSIYYPATRLLAILELLQANRQLSGPELAHRLEVDTRTVRRYIAMLQELGMPIEVERGRYGGYRLQPGYRLPPLLFTLDEALALSLGVLFARRLGFAGTVAAAESAIAKMEKVLPALLREQIRLIDETLVMRLPLPNRELSSETVMLLSLAAAQQQQVMLRYRAAGGHETRRRFDPYVLVHTIGLWYVAGYCHLRQSLRTFRIDRIQDITLRDESFSRPERFDALAFVEDAIAKTPTWPWRGEVLLHVTLEEARRLVPSATATLEETPGGVWMTCYTQDLGWLAHFLAGLDCPMTVYSPPELFDELRKLAAKINGLVGQ